MRLIERHVAGWCRDVLEHFPALVVEGARQVGKSTLAASLADSLPVGGAPTVIQTFDDAATRDAAAVDPVGFVEQAGDGLLVIDEVQRYPEITVAVKAAIDRDRRPARFILTGSADFLRQSATHDSLAGRAIGVRLLGFSQAELAGERVDFVADLRHALSSGSMPRRAGPSRDDYLARIVAGGYPPVQGLSDRLRGEWLTSYLSGLLRRDAAELLRVEPERLMSLIRLIAANQAGELVKARLAEQASLPASSITPYIDVLRRMYLIDLVPPWTPNLTSREVGRPKAIVTDAGLAARLMGATRQSLLGVPAPAALGSLVEGFVGAELLAARESSSEDFTVHHYRDRTGKEVDYVLEMADGSVLAIEVKSSQSNGARQFDGLRFLRDRLGDRFVGGIVLSMAKDSHRHGDKLWGLPISALWTA
ncbi:ATP-binding protein [Aeromicrobium fastidiosum]|uniref:ATP-binding protein n=2 Tax=Aeromicrobium fastidiosum TaxID=52699 RepID=A0A641APW4_9ACTN|nr:ATP-binding protein [Aeromicrobium fastidiosum]KAA1380144.1 ATP-binding protein [Aeromicrobium fastidiosum]MBP2389679.1 putative AAA+ superfamily ATPase [Aeromicrobium fastidiosum]